MSLEQHLKLLKRIDDCFIDLTGAHLSSPPDTPSLYQWLDKSAPYGILAHNTAADPLFIYANRYALSCFKYTSDEMFVLPSRLSAGSENRKERERLLQDVRRDGIAFNHTGPRIDKYGQCFNIYDCIVWQLKYRNGTIFGQAALFWTEEYERPEWVRKYR